MYATIDDNRFERGGELKTFADLMPLVLRQYGLNSADSADADEPLPFATRWLGASAELAVA